MSSMSSHLAVDNNKKEEELHVFTEGNNKFVGIKVKTGLNWVLVIQQEYDEVFQSVINARNTSIVIIFMSLLISCGIAYIISRKTAEALTEISLHDPLTNLPNRRLLDETMKQMIARCKRSDMSLVVVHVDIRDFKFINTEHGHHGGDIVLRELATRMKGSIRELDTIARLGGDEFVVAFSDVNRTNMQQLAKLLLRICDEPIDIEGTAVNVKINLGFAVYPEDGKTGETLIKSADHAFYESKKKGTDFEIYGG